MTAIEFERRAQDIITHCQKTLHRKAQEYAADGGINLEDRFYNFKQAGYLQNCTPEQALMGMAAKHIVSVFDMVKKEEQYLADAWDEKIGDTINYLILLRGLVVDTKRCAGESSKSIIEPFVQNSKPSYEDEEIAEKAKEFLGKIKPALLLNDNTICSCPDPDNKEEYCIMRNGEIRCDYCDYHVITPIG